MAIIGPSSQNFRPANQSVQGNAPAGLGVIYGNNPQVNAQRVAQAARKQAVNDYNARVAQYNKDLTAYNAAVNQQGAERAQLIAQINDFNNRAAQGRITFDEFKNTQFAQDIVAKYGPDAGRQLQQATYYEYLLNSPNPDLRGVGASNRKDLEFARAASLRSAQDRIRLAQMTQEAQSVGGPERIAAQQALAALARKPYLTAADVPILNQAQAVLGLPKPDYTGTITRKDGTRETYKQGMLVNVK